MSEQTWVACGVPAGPNCGLCICKLNKGHEGQHENWHGTRWPVPPKEEQWPYKNLAALQARAEAAEAKLLDQERSWQASVAAMQQVQERLEAENAALRAALVAAKRDFLGVQATCAVDYDSVSMLGQDVFNDCFYALKRLDDALTNPTATEGTTGESNGG